MDATTLKFFNDLGKELGCSIWYALPPFASPAVELSHMTALIKPVSTLCRHI